MNKETKKILVYAGWSTFENPVLMGQLNATSVRGKEIFSFEYASSWLASNFSPMIDPDFFAYPGIQYLNNQTKTNFGL